MGKKNGRGVKKTSELEDFVDDVLCAGITYAVTAKCPPAAIVVGPVMKRIQKNERDEDTAMSREEYRAKQEKRRWENAASSWH